MLFVIFMGKLRITSLLLLNYVVMLASLKHDLQHVLQQLGEEFEMTPPSLRPSFSARKLKLNL